MSKQRKCRYRASRRAHEGHSRHVQQRAGRAHLVEGFAVFLRKIAPDAGKTVDEMRQLLRDHRRILAASALGRAANRAQIAFSAPSGLRPSMAGTEVDGGLFARVLRMTDDWRRKSYFFVSPASRPAAPWRGRMKACGTACRVLTRRGWCPAGPSRRQPSHAPRIVSHVNLAFEHSAPIYSLGDEDEWRKAQPSTAESRRKRLVRHPTHLATARASALLTLSRLPMRHSRAVNVDTVD